MINCPNYANFLKIKIGEALSATGQECHRIHVRRNADQVQVEEWNAQAAISGYKRMHLRRLVISRASQTPPD